MPITFDLKTLARVTSLDGLAHAMTQVHHESLNSSERVWNDLVLQAFLIADGHSKLLFTEAHGKALVKFLRSAMAERDVVICHLLREISEPQHAEE
jgi:hypothetical protein